MFSPVLAIEASFLAGASAMVIKEYFSPKILAQSALILDGREVIVFFHVNWAYSVHKS